MNKKEKVLKVWGGPYFGYDLVDENNPRNHRRMLVAAYTKKQAMELGNLSVNTFNNYFAETGNNFELSVATEVGVWVVTDLYIEKKILGRLK